MTFKPAHKQDNPEHAPGQIRNEITLGDYIANKSRHEAFSEVKRKLTFDAWWKLMPDDGGDISRFEEEFRNCWNASKEN